ncbi:hypothetical protein [Clostridium mediterraneense]|uniref:hypothetical protein n=1 Tax=Clostridium mediterraneense TaxID=1805472 RepID=UPI00083685DC|nr:hypothetical protein [Clostridium mediterraneense]
MLDIESLLEDYKNSVEKIIKDGKRKYLESEVLELSDKSKVDYIYKAHTLDVGKINNQLNKGKAIYFPFVSGFDGEIITIVGEEFDLDVGIDFDYIEGMGYMPTSERIMDVGELSISAKNLVGFILSKDNEYKIEIGQWIKGSNNIKIVKNAGFIKKDIDKFIENYI